MNQHSTLYNFDWPRGCVANRWWRDVARIVCVNMNNKTHSVMSNDFMVNFDGSNWNDVWLRTAQWWSDRVKTHDV